MKIPALVMAPDEVVAIYDCVLLLKYVNAFVEDGMAQPPPTNLSEHFARGLTVFLDARYQNFKYQLWDSREYFKPTYTFDDAAIVIQGPIAYGNNYTAETFKLYRSIYPNSPIILSTWKGEATADFRKTCAENSVVLLENDPPEIRGSWNINLQIKSSFCGVKFVRENTATKFVLKTRTDQRINFAGFLVYFKNLLETFPPKDEKLKRRIIFSDSTWERFSPFHFCDFLAFGHVEDILKLYDAPLHKNPGDIAYALRNLARLDKLKGVSPKTHCPLDYDFKNYPPRKLRRLNRILHRTFSPERHITKNFYEKNIAPIDPTKFLETCWKFSADYLILIDFEAIQLDWPKYEFARYKPKFFYGIHAAFARWLDMYKNFKSVGGDERRST